MAKHPYFTEDGGVVLVTKDGASWQLMDGHPETGESIEYAFVREVAEVTDEKYWTCAICGARFTQC